MSKGQNYNNKGQKFKIIIIRVTECMLIDKLMKYAIFSKFSQLNSFFQNKNSILGQKN